MGYLPNRLFFCDISLPDEVAAELFWGMFDLAKSGTLKVLFYVSSCHPDLVKLAGLLLRKYRRAGIPPITPEFVSFFVCLLYFLIS